MVPDDDLNRWISGLRDCLERGALMELPPFELGHGTQLLPGETTIRIMLNDLADLEDPARSAACDPDWRQERLGGLLGDFRRLCELIG